LLQDLINYKGAKRVVTALESTGKEARFIGGAVRDSILKIAIKDIDLATPLLPGEVMKLLEKNNIKSIPTGIKFGTITAICEGNHFEITTLRKDIACDGRHAKVEFTDDWIADAARRDFTFNAMSYNIRGELFDYFGGQQDLASNIVRFVGDASSRVQEDYLRILRFFRFFAYYGREPYHPESIQACNNNAEGLASISGERIQSEMFKLLMAKDPIASLHSMQENILPKFLPIFNLNILQNLINIENKLAINSCPEIRLSALLFGCNKKQLEQVVGKLRLSNKLAKFLYNILFYQLAINDRQIKKAIRILGKEDALACLLLHFAASNDIHLDLYNIVLNYSQSEFPVKGEDLISIGIKPGEKMGELLNLAINFWEENDYKLGKDQIIEYIKKQI
jgi:poly(A) polymerase